MKKKLKTRKLTINDRWEQGIDHDPRSVELARAIAKIDYEECNDSFQFSFGGDGDNGETLMYLLDLYFEGKDNRAKGN